MEVERSLGKPGCLDDLVDGGVFYTCFEAALAPQLQRSIDQLLPGADGTVLEQSGAAWNGAGVGHGAIPVTPSRGDGKNRTQSRYLLRYDLACLLVRPFDLLVSLRA